MEKTRWLKSFSAVLGVLIAGGPALPQSAAAPGEARKPPAAAVKWATVSVNLPADDSQFPPGKGADITGVCLICHSAEMVLRQPPLPRDTWVTEINKMRNVYGAPLPADQVDALADYLFAINGLKKPADAAAH